MTISSTTRKAGPFTGNGVAVAFPFAYKVFAASEVLVVQAVTATGMETIKVLTTDYTVALNADQDASPGGTVTMLIAPPAGTTLTLASQVSNLQPTNLTNAGGFYPSVINSALDRCVIQIQQLAEKLGRTLSISISSSSSGQLPAPVALALLGWNSTATAVQNFAGTASTLVSTFMATVVAAVDGATARASLGSTAVGDALFTSANAATARGVLGAQTQAATAFPTTGVAPAYVVTASPAVGLVADTRLQLTFHASTSGACTLAANGTAATAIKQYDSTGAKIDPVIVAAMKTDVVYDGTHWVIVDPLPASGRQIQPVTASVASNALTCTLASTSLDFRSATLGSGTVVTRNVPSAISVVVPSTATLGTVSAVQSRIALLAIDNAGTVELAVVNIAGGNDLSETGLVSTTAISAGATAANVVYSTSARTNVAYRVVGYVESTQATAGTWATAPSTIQGQGGQALAAMSSLGYGQTWQNVTGSRALATTYYNTTGRPISIAVNANGSASLDVLGNTTITVSGLNIVTSSTTNRGTIPNAGCTAIVPAGATYSASGTGALTSWAELR